LPSGVIAESWEIAAHEDGTTTVDNGPLAGRTLTQLHDDFGLDLIGRRAAWAHERGKFPLLVKLLDANRNLSVQVHPDDAYALAHESNELGKTEMWVVLHAEPDAKLILGVTAGTTAENFRQALEQGDLMPRLHHVPVKRGDVVCVPSGSLHAILSGTVIAEIQQNSNATYRVFDWYRLRDGAPRPLHVDRAMDVINFQHQEPQLCQPALIRAEEGIRSLRLCHNPYFVTDRVEMNEGARYEGHCDGSSLTIWGVLDGEVRVNAVELAAVRFALLPATMGAYSLVADSDSTLLRVSMGQSL
jgi:mannose-6-phosphate isomerase